MNNMAKEEHKLPRTEPKEDRDHRDYTPDREPYTPITPQPGKFDGCERKGDRAPESPE